MPLPLERKTEVEIKLERLRKKRNGSSLWWRDGKNGLSVLVRCCTCLADVRNCKRVTKTGRMLDEGRIPRLSSGEVSNG